MARRKSAELVLAGIPRVNLMPQAEIHRRERIDLTRGWAIGAGAAVLIALLVIGGAFAWRTMADQRLAAEQERTNALIEELATYSDVSVARSDAAALVAFRDSAMATDLAWSPLIGGVVSALPEGVTLSTFALAPGAPPLGDDRTRETGASGTLNFTGVNAADQAVTVAALRGVPGVMDADAGALSTAGESGYSFDVSITFDQTVYSGRFARQEND